MSDSASEDLTPQQKGAKTRAANRARDLARAVTISETRAAKAKAIAAPGVQCIIAFILI
jgi:hypothetical protein